MDSKSGIFLESLFATLGFALLILDNNGAGFILCVIIVGLIDLTWSW